MARLKLRRRKIVTAPAVVSPTNLVADDARVIHSAERAGFEGWKAFDGDVYSSFNNGFVNTNDPTYIGWCFDTAQEIVQWRWKMPDTSGFYTANAWKLEYSDDGVNWSTAVNYPSEYYSGQGAGWWTSSAFASVGAHRWWRMNLTTCSNWLSWCYFASVEFWASSTTYFPP